VNTDVAVFLVDDQVSFLRAAAAVVGATDGFRVVGCATSGVYASEQIAERGGELGLVLLDVQLGDLDGPAVRSRIAHSWPDLPVAYLSSIDPADLPEDAGDVPVIGFLPKSTFGPEALYGLCPRLDRPSRRRIFLP
jgi:DNA-binding NarL/FixJ family response regulator